VKPSSTTIGDGGIVGATAVSAAAAGDDVCCSCVELCVDDATVLRRWQHEQDTAMPMNLQPPPPPPPRRRRPYSRGMLLPAAAGVVWASSVVVVVLSAVSDEVEV